MYFNYPSESILPGWLEDSITNTREMIGKADKELKYGINESFERIPFNLVTRVVLEERLRDVRVKYTRAFEKAPDRIGIFIDCESLLEKTFRFSPFSLIVNKGVSSDGKEALVSCEWLEPPLFLFNTVYPLCWDVLSKNKFAITKHSLYPLFHRYMQEPLAVAMTLSVVDKAFGDNPYARDCVLEYLSKLPENYYAGALLYEYELHMRWKDWRDDSNRVIGKFDAIKEWIDLLSKPYEAPDRNEFFSLWVKLFDLSAGEIQGLEAAAKYAPVVAESNKLPSLLLGLFHYAENNHSAFQNKKVKESKNSIAKTITELISNQISLDDAAGRASEFSNEQLIREFIGEDMPGWSFAKDLHNGRFRIYGRLKLIAIANSGAVNKADSMP